MRGVRMALARTLELEGQQVLQVGHVGRLAAHAGGHRGAARAVERLLALEAVWAWRGGAGAGGVGAGGRARAGACACARGGASCGAQSRRRWQRPPRGFAAVMQAAHQNISGWSSFLWVELWGIVTAAAVPGAWRAVIAACAGRSGASGRAAAGRLAAAGTPTRIVRMRLISVVGGARPCMRGDWSRGFSATARSLREGGVLNAVSMLAKDRTLAKVKILLAICFRARPRARVLRCRRSRGTSRCEGATFHKARFHDEKHSEHSSTCFCGLDGRPAGGSTATRRLSPVRRLTAHAAATLPSPAIHRFLPRC